MKKNHNCFASVIYPASFCYFSEFIDSIADQDCESFDVLLVSDGVSREDVNKIVSTYSLSIVVVDAPSGKTPGELRTFMLKEAKKAGYEICISGDSDDTFSEDRVSSAIDYLKNHSELTFCYNCLQDFDGNVVIKNVPQMTESLECILHYNYIGMSNITINLDKISASFIESLDEFIGDIYDWYLVNRLLLTGLKGGFVKKGYTKYRYHEGNIVGKQENRIDSIIREVQIKTTHYKLLSRYNKVYDILRKKYEEEKYIVRDNIEGYWWGQTKVEEI